MTYRDADKEIIKKTKRWPVFRDVASCILVEIDRRFRGAYCLHHHGDSTSQKAAILIHVAVRNSNLKKLYNLQSSQNIHKKNQEILERIYGAIYPSVGRPRGWVNVPAGETWRINGRGNGHTQRISFMYLLMMHLTTLSVSQIIYCRMVGYLVNNELVIKWKIVVVAQFKIGLLSVHSPVKTEENHEVPQSGEAVSGLEPSAFRMRTSANTGPRRPINRRKSLLCCYFIEYKCHMHFQY
jgi:hypothetical protein